MDRGHRPRRRAAESMTERVAPRIVNLRTAPIDEITGPDSIYIGRPSKWGNPFTHLRRQPTRAGFLVDTREAAIYSYERWIRDQPELMSSLDELTGKILRCYCKPLFCHGDILIKLWKERFS
jgi:hypothetical protein